MLHLWNFGAENRARSFGNYFVQSLTARYAEFSRTSTSTIPSTSESRLNRPNARGFVASYDDAKVIDLSLTLRPVQTSLDVAL